MKSASNKLNNLFSKVELTAFAQGHFSVIYDRANSDLRLNMMVTTLPAGPDEGQLSSGCCRSRPPREFTVSYTLRSFGRAGLHVATGRYQGTADIADRQRAAT